MHMTRGMVTSIRGYILWGTLKSVLYYSLKGFAKLTQHVGFLEGLGYACWKETAEKPRLMRFSRGCGMRSRRSVLAFFDLEGTLFRFMKEDQCQTIRFGGSHIGRQTRVLLLVIITWRCVWAEIDVRWCAENFHKKLLPFLAEQPEARHLVLSVLESVRTPTDCRRHCGEKAFLCHVVAFRGIPDFFGKAA